MIGRLLFVALGLASVAVVISIGVLSGVWARTMLSGFALGFGCGCLFVEVAATIRRDGSTHQEEDGTVSREEARGQYVTQEEGGRCKVAKGGFVGEALKDPARRFEYLEPEGNDTQEVRHQIRPRYVGEENGLHTFEWLKPD